MGRVRWGIAAASLTLLVVAGCGGGSDASSSRPHAPVGTAVSTTVSTTLPPVTVPPVTVPPVTVPPSPVDELVGVGGARQVISVIADGYGQTTATLIAYERRDDGWHEVFGPWTANVGARGFAPPEEKREGDLRTPSGAFGLDFAFGILADPGVRLPYRRVTSNAIVWDDDPSSARYNLWTDSSTDLAGADPEPMYNAPAYNHGVVIAYNAERVPGLGSAIFLHVTKGGSTAGCVALPQDQLIELLRWLDLARDPRIVMGTRAAVTA